jgi:hypothetical protein
MSSTVQLTFRYEEIDYVRAFRTMTMSRKRLWIDLAVMAPCIALGIYFRIIRPEVSTGWFLIGCASVYTLVLALLWHVVPRVAFRQDPKRRDEYFLAFSPEGIHFRTGQADSHLQWSFYYQAIVTSHAYLLVYGKRHFSVIPKRVFRNAEEQGEFEKLLTTHIPKIILRD